jgi:adenine-specific DNA-methyltransferase
MGKRAQKADSKAPGKAEVETYKHKEAKRKNIPTAELQKLVPDDDKAIKKLRWPRNPDLDPQLVWRGKDFEPDPLEVDAPPIYIQEKILPRAIIEDLRRQTKERRADDASQFDFFHDFNGLADPEAKTEFYAHDQNWSNRMILGDSLLVMASLAEREGLRGKMQCIYMDPPYGIRFNSNWQPSTQSRDVKDGNNDSVSREPEVIRAFRDTWKDEIHSYLSYFRDRLIAARDLLHDSGSVFVQIGDENLHLVCGILDEVFNSKNYVAKIAFAKTSGSTREYLSGQIDYIVWYAKNRESMKYRQLYHIKEIGGAGASGYNQVQDESGLRRPLMVAELDAVERIKGRIFTRDNLTSQSIGREKGEGAASWFKVDFEGNSFVPSEKGRWKTNETGMVRLARSNRLARAGTTLRYVRFIDDFIAYPITDLWNDTTVAGFVSNKKYVVETSTKVVERCLLMTTDAGDLVVDPTCGGGTTAYVAEQWGRRWITIDTSRVALMLTRARLMSAKYDYYLLRDSAYGAVKEGEITGTLPQQGPFGQNIRQGFVAERTPHVMLRSIVSNSEIDVIWERWQKTLDLLREKLNKALGRNSVVMPGLVPGIHDLSAPAKKDVDGRDKPGHDGYGAWEEWQVPREADEKWPEATKQLHAQWWEARRARQKEIDESIARNADVEFLYDRPYKARGVVRVAGPFTVESLSPHRVLPMGEDPYLAEILGAEGKDVDGRVDPRIKSGNGHDEKGGPVITDFAQVVYENLKTAGVQNTKKGETLKFEWLKPFASRSGLIQFEGRYQEKGESKRAAVCIGPEYDTVGYDLVRRAAREAADLFDTLIICGFAFAPEVDDTRLNFGSLTVLKARMNQDLRMADKLKATGASNLFVVFGEPDIVIHRLKDDMLKVEIRGMDIFDPTTGEVRSSGGKELMNDVAAWFIDHDYDEESFFVRQAYFVGDDPYDGLKRALKADIDETAWAELNSTVSRPFPRPDHGRICVKVINHFGDEVQKVFQV